VLFCERNRRSRRARTAPWRVRYSYPWHTEYREGRGEGVKDQPRAIVLAVENHGHNRPRATAPLITHTPPKDPALAIELPPPTKNRFGLNADCSWIVLTESNEFFWPGPDLRQAKGKGDGSVAYGFLPPGSLCGGKAALCCARRGQ
jgi:hypothetical protein